MTTFKKDDFTQFLNNSVLTLNNVNTRISSLSPTLSAVSEHLFNTKQTIAKATELTNSITSEVTQLSSLESDVQATLDALDTRMDTATASKVSEYASTLITELEARFDSRLWWRQNFSTPEGASYTSITISILDHTARLARSFLPSSQLPSNAPDSPMTRPRVVIALSERTLEYCQEVIAALIKEFGLYNITEFCQKNSQPGDLSFVLDLIVSLSNSIIKFKLFTSSILSKLPFISFNFTNPEHELFPIYLELESKYLYSSLKLAFEYDQELEAQILSNFHQNLKDQKPEPLLSGNVADSLFVLECSIERSFGFLSNSILNSIIHEISSQLPSIFKTLSSKIGVIFDLIDDDRITFSDGLVLITCLVNDAGVIPSIPGRLVKRIKGIYGNLTANQSQLIKIDDVISHVNSILVEKLYKNFANNVSKHILSLFRPSLLSLLPRSLPSVLSSQELTEDPSNWVTSLCQFLEGKVFGSLIAVGCDSWLYFLGFTLLNFILSRIEFVVFKSDFNVFGGLCLEKDVNFVFSFASNLFNQSFSSLFSRFQQVSLILTLTSLEDLTSFLETDFEWVLSNEEIGKILLLRKDFGVDQVRQFGLKHLNLSM
ncbi:hypothetical protein P9112_012563 [Eukaryota sp. TZLM1-RC]